MDGFSVASCIGPVLMTPSTPLLIYKRSNVDGSLQLVATGSLLSIDPDRIMLKKIILTGNPIRVKKRSGVIKHMFYDPLVSHMPIYICVKTWLICVILGCEIL